jgi:DNA-binding response OmpR family regulator
VVSLPLLTRSPSDRRSEPPEAVWQPPLAITVGGGRLPAGTLTAVADESIVLDAHQLDVLGRLPPPTVVLVAAGPDDPPALALVRGVRDRTDVAVIALLDGASERDRIGVLHAGADDCLDAAAGIGELLARIEVIGRRGVLRVRAQQAGGVTLEHLTRRAWVGSTPLELTRLEFDLLAHFVASPRQVFSRDQLLRVVWGQDHVMTDPATVTEHVRRLRAKLGDAGGSRDCIRTLRGVGYRFEPERCTAGCRWTIGPEDGPEDGPAGG